MVIRWKGKRKKHNTNNLAFPTNMTDQFLRFSFFAPWLSEGTQQLVTPSLTPANPTNLVGVATNGALLLSSLGNLGAKVKWSFIQPVSAFVYMTKKTEKQKHKNSYKKNEIKQGVKVI